MTALTTRILKAATSEEAKKLFDGVKGSVLQSKLKRKLIESNDSELDPKLSFLQAEIKSPSYLPPDNSKYLAARMNKWQLISENMAKMDSVILKEYRERRRESKEKGKKNKNPF
jgi:hypothetical protein